MKSSKSVIWISITLLLTLLWSPMVTLSGVIPNVGGPSKINNVKMIVMKNTCMSRQCHREWRCWPLKLDYVLLEWLYQVRKVSGHACLCKRYQLWLLLQFFYWSRSCTVYVCWGYRFCLYFYDFQTAPKVIYYMFFSFDLNYLYMYNEGHWWPRV